MLIALAASYTSIPIIISLLESKNNEFHILTPDKNIYNFFLDLYGKNHVLYYESPNYSIFPIKLLEIVHKIKNINKHKAAALKLINQYEKCDIYTTDIIAFCEFEFWLVKELSKNNHIKFHPVVNVDDSIKKLNNFTKTIYEFANWFIYKTKPTACMSYQKITFRINESYQKQIKSESFDIEIDYYKLGKIIQEKYNLDNYKVIILSGGVVDYFVNKKNYIEITDRIISLLEKYFDKNLIAVKAHPRFQEYYSMETDLRKIPPKIPSSLLTQNFDYLIGFHSNSLVEASKVGKIVISTIKLFKLIEEENVEFDIQYLLTNMDANNPILFPQSIEELETILDKYS